ncbi:CHASE domain-containing protein [Ferrimonas pelagia]|uniref:diguanylate cyclase n=1 Tax=Ferrimonas pelagia TaxID=1177826 RepID=A0ABP9EGR3_9GAMM
MQRLLVFLFSVIAGCALFLSLAHRLYQQDRQVLEDELRHNVEIQADVVRWRIRSSFDTLHQLSVLFLGSESVSRDEFAAASEGILARNREIKALEWVPKIAHAQREQMERDWHDRQPGFTFTERHSGGMITARPRSWYYPVYFVEPMVTNEKAFGFDLGSEPSRFASLTRARDSGEMVASPPIALVQDKEPQKAVLVLLPIYRQLPNTLKRRQEFLQGFVTGVFRIEDMLRSGFFSREQSLIDYQLIDDSGNVDVLMTVGEFSDEMASHAVNIMIDNVGGRHWRLQARPQRHYYTQQMSYLPFFLGAGGCLATLLIAFSVFQLLRRNQAIARLVQERTEELDVANQKLVRLSLTDGLTEVANRRQFDLWLEQEWKAGARSGKPLCLMLLDVDHFKAYNDNYGHRAGDQTLRNIAKALHKRLNRPRDMLARYGGEEFAVILPESSENPAVLGRGLCEAVMAEQIKHEFGGDVGVVTVSIGVATLVPGGKGEAKHLVELADQALYRAKADGRNQVVCYGGRPAIQPLDQPA